MLWRNRARFFVRAGGCRGLSLSQWARRRCQQEITDTEISPRGCALLPGLAQEGGPGWGAQHHSSWGTFPALPVPCTKALAPAPGGCGCLPQLLLCVRGLRSASCWSLAGAGGGKEAAAHLLAMHIAPVPVLDWAASQHPARSRAGSGAESSPPRPQQTSANCSSV